ncbi:hypothetical protein ACFSYG_11950 [Leeuwenhoekiella polynyae]|uniref:Uncharacterized protein n=1 Tax=Leeuwenhoekiella polynyae TaxID=1550906 RepID=A0A4Q0PFT5_9FLAO|nr:hypothetical protein [Leeuwenhoekiella polynyae]RXG25691.1 hypothetical protein DSM02_858 [Leeuwenhoekiella polynyae]
MFLQINIPDLTAPVIRGPRLNFGSFPFKVQLLKPFYRFLEFYYKRSLDKWFNRIDGIILSLEGSLDHINDLTPEQAKETLLGTKDVIEDVIKLENTMALRYLFKNSAETKIKYKYLLKLLYKIEARCHRIVYRNAPVIKTDKDLIDGVRNMNARYLNNNAI